MFISGSRAFCIYLLILSVFILACGTGELFGHSTLLSRVAIGGTPRYAKYVFAGFLYAIGTFGTVSAVRSLGRSRN